MLSALLCVLVGGVAAGTSSNTPDGCTMTDFGAVPGNRTADARPWDARRNQRAITAALGRCRRVVVPRGVFKIAPVALPSHSMLYLQAGAVLVG